MFFFFFLSFDSVAILEIGRIWKELERVLVNIICSFHVHSRSLNKIYKRKSEEGLRINVNLNLNLNLNQTHKKKRIQNKAYII